MKKIFNPVLFLLACIVSNSLQAQGPEKPLPPKKKHYLYTDVFGNVVGRFNLGYNYRLSATESVGAEVMYTPLFFWAHARYEEFATNGYFDPHIGTGARLRVHFKHFPLYKKGRGQCFFVAGELEGRKAVFRDVNWESIEVYADYSIVDVHRTAVLASVLAGTDFTKGKGIIGGFFGLTGGMQWNRLEEVSGNWPVRQDVVRTNVIFGPRLGLTFCFEFGEDVSDQK